MSMNSMRKSALFWAMKTFDFYPFSFLVSIFAALLMLNLPGCGSPDTQQYINQTVTTDKDTILLGHCTRTGLESPPFNSWFESRYHTYRPSENILDSLKTIDTTKIHVRLFMGTWCPDSHRDVPAFYKIIDSLPWDKTMIRQVCLDQEKQSPSQEEEVYGIERVPTFIFYRKGKEIGRIVEYADVSIEADMLHIFTQESG